MAGSIDDLIAADRHHPPQVVRRPDPAPDLEVRHDPVLRLAVSWGDFTRVDADIHVAGHYQGVMPAAAELALDVAVSRPDGRRVIGEHTRRRWLVGALGEVSYFPGSAARADGSAVRLAAVVGMGRVGTFNASSACVLYESLLSELAGLPAVRSAVVVPIGAGAGNLRVEQVATAVVTGFGQAVATLATPARPLELVTITEIDRLVAEQLHEALVAAAGPVPGLEVAPELVPASGGRLSPTAAAVLTLRTVLSRLGHDADPRAAAREALCDLPDDVREQATGALGELLLQPRAVVGVSLQDVGRRVQDVDAGGLPPTRLSVRHSAGGLSWSALTARATVPEREVVLNERILADLAARLTAPGADDARQLPHLMSQWLLPEDLHAHLLGDAPLVIEVDRYSARLPWEFLVPPDSGPEDAEPPEPLAVSQCLARQMRTSYARTDLDATAALQHRALVIGDPGDPARNQQLPGAREEALEVAAQLRDAGFAVDALIGPTGSTPPEGAKPAVLLDALARILTGRYDVIHYSGHGTLVPERPELSGWLFADGILAARELVQLRRAPWLVMANACWSAARPDADLTDAAVPTGQRGELAPLLADEFLRVGVGHFIGTSWRIPDAPARRFAADFYRGLLGTAQTTAVPAGQALRAARRELWRDLRTDESPEVASAWAAYQHYGDPGDRFPRRTPRRS